MGKHPMATTEVVGTWARALSVSEEAVRLVVESDTIDLHVDSFIWTRLLGYQLAERHGMGPLRARWLGQVDLPRLRQAHVDGAIWVITTNPLRSERGRLRALHRNIRRLTDEVSSAKARARVVRSRSEYRSARAAGLHGAFLAIQGGHALSDPEAPRVVNVSDLTLVTLVHLTSSALAESSFRPRWKRDRGLLPKGRAIIEWLESERVLVDLAHASPQSFWDTVEHHDHTRPLIVSHTGLSSVYRSWRNISDHQLRAIADSGGVVGIMYHGPYLGDGAVLGQLGGRAATVANHVAHAISVVGAEHVSLGSDWDGLIATPLDMPTSLELPVLVQALLDRRVSPQQIEQILGQSFLRVVGLIRP